jgi:Uncharacterised protein family (UPF0203)
MGSTQSRSSSKDASNIPPSVESSRLSRENPVPNDAVSTAADNTATTTIEYHDANRPEGGMPLVHYVCRKRKQTYDKCVKTWYSKEFMTGAGSLNQEEVCGDAFEAYKSCILKGIRKEIWDKEGLPPPAEGSPLADVVDDNHDERT